MFSENNIPACIGVVLDGNRRWAKERNLPSHEGHREGFENLKRLVDWTKEVGIAHMAVYVFSTENWKRSTEEVGYLMDMMRTQLKKKFEELKGDDVAIRFIGDLSLFDDDIQKLISNLHDANPEQSKHHVWIAASYGGRSEIVSAVNRLLVSGVEKVTEEDFANALWTKGMPDPDIIIRTGGNRRLSNFLTWASVYSELFFVDTFWPAFTKEQFLEILREYEERKRNFGK
jgi:undecaprenyl diphosphate synthase